MATVTPVAAATEQGDSAWQYIGPDERGRELEVVAVEGAGQGEAELFVIHVMPTSLRRGKRDV
jgi:hypothetical protein